MRARLLPAIFLGGMAGGLARAALEHEWPAGGHSWPWVTFAVNIAGTAILAALLALVQRRPAPPPYLGPFVGIGLCGALTTFSTLQLESVVLVHGGHALLGIVYALGSISGGLLTAGAMSGAALWIAVALVSGAGACLRYLLDAAVTRSHAGRFPLGILIVNGLGSFVLGLLHGAGVTGDDLLLAGTALLGSFTTFSTWVVQSERLAVKGEGGLAVVNVAGSLVLGVAAVIAGWALGAGL